MKRVIYSLIALTLILPACGVAKEPERTSELEPYTQISVVPKEELSKLKFTHPYFSYPFEEGEVKNKDSYKTMIASSVEAKQKKLESQKAKVIKPRQAVRIKTTVKPKVKALSAPKESVKKNEPEGSERTFTLTAYTSGKESTGKSKGDKNYGITASGKKVKEGRTISCPPSYKLGTKIHIPSLNKTYVCEDRGSAIKGNILDVYIEDLDRALEFGRKKNVKGYILKES